jgi:micrococcal nuclease
LNTAALIRPLGVLLLLLPLGLAPARGEVAGRVVSVHDGDTLTVLVERRVLRVRLVDIDAPELDQHFGARARGSLAELCSGKTALLDVRASDRYQRAIARVTCAGSDASTEQVRRGYAWAFRRYAAPDSPLYVLEREARAAHRGLWAEPAPTPPWKWRRLRREGSG